MRTFAVPDMVRARRTMGSGGFAAGRMGMPDRLAFFLLQQHPGFGRRDIAVLHGILQPQLTQTLPRFRARRRDGLRLAGGR